MDQNSEYDELLSVINDYVTVKPVNKPKTIYLFGKRAKGNIGIFSQQPVQKISFLSYVLNGNSHDKLVCFEIDRNNDI